jgi:hypothetical protein
VRSRRGPRRWKPDKFRADEGYDSDPHRQWLHRRKIVPRIASRGLEDPARLGRHGWKIERTIAWLTSYCQWTIRYERDSNHFLTFL